MLAVIVYDISTKDASGKKRLRLVRKKCLDWGVPVQSSVFECELTAEQMRKLTQELETLISSKEDSICIYSLGRQFQQRISRLGRRKVTWDRETFVL